MAVIQLSQDICRDLGAAGTREWLETNGLGGFASSTIVGLNTRRYHGLLVAATMPPVGRMVLVSKLEETLFVDGRRYELSANQYPGAVYPEGFQFQTGFRLDPFPVFSYRIEGIEIEKSVFMIQGENTTVVQYDFRGPDEPPAGDRRIAFEVRPLIAFRDYHSLARENGLLDARVAIEDGLAVVAPYAAMPSLYLACDQGEIGVTGDWYRNFEYRVEQERGFEFHEDLFNPFVISFRVDQTALATMTGTRISLIASTERRDAAHADDYRASEITRRETIARSAHRTGDLSQILTTAADQFVVTRDSHKTIIAGYPWFADWGRDTMISLPGLTLATGRVEVAKSILLEYSKYVDQGMLPNRFPDAGESPEYNTVDATLWFFEAVRTLVSAGKEFDFVRDNLYGVLAGIIDWHLRGTRYGIHMDEDGLLYSGEPGVQLTWMDAKVGDWVVTPRTGKAVEIQALWYNALQAMEGLATEFGVEAAKREYKALASRARRSFNELFWNPQACCLYDVVNGDQRDASIRPNQILAISLANSMVTRARAREILRVVERDLLTPRGLRTLSPTDPQYAGRYEGDSLSRDGAYHQGTVWPWLMGPYMSAYAKTFGPKAGRDFATAWLRSFQDHFTEGCLGQVSEIFDGDPPHTPRGCVAQAWSVAELLRACVMEDNAS